MFIVGLLQKALLITADNFRLWGLFTACYVLAFVFSIRFLIICLIVHLAILYICRSKVKLS